MVEPALATKYECPQNCKILRTDKESYEYVKFLGQGGCGAVLEYRNMGTGNRVAAKVETQKKSASTLTPEELNLKNLWRRNPEQPIKHLPKFFGSVIIPEYYIFIELFPTTLESYLKQDLPNNQGKPSLVKVALQMMAALKEMHDRDFVHRDVKTENFMVDNHVVKIIDFGLSHNFMKDGKHTADQKVGFQGTIPFGSVNILQGNNGFRRDDLESLGYAIMTLIDNEKVPWKPFQNDTAKNIELKLKFAAEERPDPVFHGIQKFIKRVQALKFDEKPDYEALEKDIENMLFDEKKFNKMFEDALPQFYTRLARQVMQEAKSEACETAVKTFLIQAKKAKVLYDQLDKIIERKQYRDGFSKSATFSAIKANMAVIKKNYENEKSQLISSHGIEKEKLQRELAAKNQEIQYQTARATTAESSLAAAQAALATTQQQLQIEEAKSKSLTDEKNRLTLELQDTQTNLGIEEQQHVKTQRELISTMGKFEKTQKDLTDTKQELDAVSAGLAQTCLELEDFKNKLEAAEKLISEKNVSISHKDTLLKWAKETEDKLTAENQELKEEKSDLHKSLESTQKQLNEKTAECKGLQDALAGEKDYTAQLEDQNKKNKKDKERLEEEKKLAQTLLNTERTSLTNLRKSLEDQISSLTSSLTTAKGQFDKTQEDLTSKIAQLTKDLGQERSYAAKLHEDLHTEQGKVTALEFNLQQAGIRASEQDSEIHDLKTKIQKTDSVCVDLLRHFQLDAQQQPEQSIIDHMNQRLRDYKVNQDAAIQTLNSEAQQKIQQLEEDLKAQKCGFEQLQHLRQTERGSADQMLSQMTSTHAAEVQRLKTQVEPLGASSETAVCDLKKLLEDRRNENQAISQQLSQSEASLSSAKKKLKRLTRQHAGQIETLKSEKTQLERQLDEKIKEFDTVMDAVYKKEEADLAKTKAELASLKIEFDLLVETSRKFETEKENLQKELKFQEDKHKKYIEQAPAALTAQTTPLLDKIKELEMDKEFISASLAQAKTDIEMQTKARADLFKKWQDSMNASTALNASASTEDTEIDKLRFEKITLETSNKDFEFKLQNITTLIEQFQREFEKAKEELQIARGKIQEHEKTVTASTGQPSVQSLQADVNRLQTQNLALKDSEEDLKKKVQSAEAHVTQLTDEVAKLQRENQDLKAHKVEPQESLQAQTNNEGNTPSHIAPHVPQQEEEKTSQMEEFLKKIIQGRFDESDRHLTQHYDNLKLWAEEKDYIKTQAEKQLQMYQKLKKTLKKERSDAQQKQKAQHILLEAQRVQLQDLHAQLQAQAQSQTKNVLSEDVQIESQLSIATIKSVFRKNLIDPQAPAVYIQSPSFPAKVEVRNDTLDSRSDVELRAAFNEALLQSKKFRESLIEVVNKTESNQYTITLEPSQMMREQARIESPMEEEKGEIETDWRSPSQQALYTKTQNEEENMSILFNQLYQSRKAGQPFAVQVKVSMKEKAKGQKLIPDLEQLERQSAIQFFTDQVKGLQSQMDQQKNGILKTFRFQTNTAHWKEVVKPKKVMDIPNATFSKHWVLIEVRNKNMPLQRHYFQMSEEVIERGTIVAWQVENVKLPPGTYYYQYIVIKENKGLQELEAQYFQDYQGTNQVGTVEIKGPEDQESGRVTPRKSLPTTPRKSLASALPPTPPKNDL